MVSWRNVYEYLVEHRVQILLLLIILFGFSIRTLPVRVGPHYWDETVYLQHEEILGGERADKYNEFEFRPPLLSVLLGSVFAVDNSLIAAHIVIAFLASLGLVAVYLLGKELYGSTTGIIATLIYALSTEHIRVSHTVLVDGILPTAWLLTAYFLLRTVKLQRPRYAILAGVLTGMAILLKFTSLILLPTAIGILALTYYKLEDSDVSFKHIRSWPQALRYRLPWYYLLGCLLTLSPYLIWSFTVFDHPLHPFISGLQASGAPSPPLTYLLSFPVLFPLPFTIGLALFLPLLRRLQDREIYYPLLFILSLAIPLQFMISHKEPRYILPVIPFLSLIAARGLATLWPHFPSSRSLYSILVAVLITATLLTTPILALYVYPPLTGTTTFSDSGTPMYDTAVWINNHTAPESIVYGNYELSVLAYYSDRRTIHLPRTTDLDTLLEGMENSGYFVYTDHAPAHFTPGLDTFRTDPRFSETYKNAGTYVFLYDPSQTDSINSSR